MIRRCEPNDPQDPRHTCGHLFDDLIQSTACPHLALEEANRLPERPRRRRWVQVIEAGSTPKNRPACC